MRRPAAIALTLLAGCAQPERDLCSERGTVVVFVATDCPIANSYAPELREIAAAHAGAGLRFWCVHADPSVTRERAQEHAREYGLPGEIVLDLDHRLARRLGARVTPEAFVLLPDGTVVYRGRIDDGWRDVGQRQRVVTRRDLRDALAAVAAGRLPEVRETEAVGCLIE